MPIQFACPSCGRRYSVKSELAGKGAKCGQCGHKMKIPQAASAQSASAAKGSAPSKVAATKPVAAKPTAAKPASAKPATAKQAAKTSPPPPPTADPALSSWLDEELESSRTEVKAKPQPPPSTATCPSCNAPLAAGAVLCVKCGYDTRTRGRRTVEHVADEVDAPQRSKLGTAASLLRGTFFSFIAAMLGAVIWATLAYLTLKEFWFMAWALGGLAGFGMALGHEDDDGTFAGIIAAFMSIVGIIAAKVCIIVIFVAAAVSSAVSEFEENLEQGGAVEFQRAALAMAMAMKDLEAQGVTMDNVDEAQFEAAVEKARAEVADLPPGEIDLRIEQLAAQHGLEGELEEEDVAESAEPDEDPNLAENDAAESADDADEAVAEDDDEVTFGSVLGELFGPMDGFFILLAFFTAYKVGSGEIGD